MPRLLKSAPRALAVGKEGFAIDTHPCHTHEKVRTLTRLAQICPLLPVWNTQFRRSTVDGGRASLASPVLPTRITGSWSWLRFACSDPHSPSLEEGVAGTIARMLRRRLTGLMHPVHLRPCGNATYPVYRKTTKPARSGRSRTTHTTTGPDFTRNLLTITTAVNRVKRLYAKTCDFTGLKC
jgi:hypothetical protein